MASFKCKAVVVESKDYKEKDKQVLLYSLENGKFWATLKSARGEKSKNKVGKEPFCFGEFLIENTRGTNIVVGVDVIDSFFGLTSDLDKFYEACGILEIIKKITNYEESDAMLFMHFVKALKCICYEDCKNLYVIDKFLIDIFFSMGFYFNVNCCSSCGATLTSKKYLNYDVGELVCSKCRSLNSEELLPSVLAVIKILNNTDYEKIPTLKFSQNSEKDALRILTKNFEGRFMSKLNLMGLL